MKKCGMNWLRMEMTTTNEAKQCYKAYASTCDFVDGDKVVNLKGYGFIRANEEK